MTVLFDERNLKRAGREYVSFVQGRDRLPAIGVTPITVGHTLMRVEVDPDIQQLYALTPLGAFPLDAVLKRCTPGI